MQRTYQNIHPDCMEYRPVSRYIQIRFNSHCDPFFIYRGKRMYFTEWENLTYPIMVEDSYGQFITIGYYRCFCNWGGLLLEVHPDCEYVRVWEEVVKDE